MPSLHEHNLPGPCTATLTGSLFIVRRKQRMLRRLEATSARAAMRDSRTLTQLPLQTPGPRQLRRRPAPCLGRHHLCASKGLRRPASIARADVEGWSSTRDAGMTIRLRPPGAKSSGPLPACPRAYVGLCTLLSACAVAWPSWAYRPLRAQQQQLGPAHRPAQPHRSSRCNRLRGQSLS